MKLVSKTDMNHPTATAGLLCRDD